MNRTHGTPISMMLLKTWLPPNITTSWIPRSMRQPAGSHCERNASVKFSWRNFCAKMQVLRVVWKMTNSGKVRYQKSEKQCDETKPCIRKSKMLEIKGVVLFLEILWKNTTFFANKSFSSISVLVQLLTVNIVSRKSLEYRNNLLPN